MRRFYVLVVVGFWFSGPAVAAALPACAGAVQGTHARVVRVEKNGALILNDGHTAMLEGIRLALADGGPPGLAQETTHQLGSLTAGDLILASLSPGQDRYGRVRVQVFATSSGFWLQGELLRRGLARVQIAPDSQECAPDLYAAETEGRAAKMGLWAFAAFTPRKVGKVPLSDAGHFQIVEGKVVNAANHDGRVFLDFSADYRSGFSAIIAPEDHKAFRKMTPRLEELAGHTVRLRGMVEVYGGRPEIFLSNPAQIELIQ